MTTTNPDRQANIAATERRYSGALRHVPSGKSAGEVRLLDIRQFDPLRDEALVEEEVRKVLEGVRFVGQSRPAGAPPAAIYCSSQVILDKVAAKLTAAEQGYVRLAVGV